MGNRSSKVEHETSDATNSKQPAAITPVTSHVSAETSHAIHPAGNNEQPAAITPVTFHVSDETSHAIHPAGNNEQPAAITPVTFHVFDETSLAPAGNTEQPAAITPVTSHDVPAAIPPTPMCNVCHQLITNGKKLRTCHICSELYHKTCAPKLPKGVDEKYNLCIKCIPVKRHGKKPSDVCGHCGIDYFDKEIAWFCHSCGSFAHEECMDELNLYYKLDVCKVCHNFNDNTETQIIQWIQCYKCLRWVHLSCVPSTSRRMIEGRFKCIEC